MCDRQKGLKNKWEHSVYGQLLMHHTVNLCSGLGDPEWTP